MVANAVMRAGHCTWAIVARKAMISPTRELPCTATTPSASSSCMAPMSTPAPSGEADQHRLGQELDQHRATGKGGDQANEPGQQGESGQNRQRRLHDQAVLREKWCHRRQNEKAGGVGRPGDHLATVAGNGGDQTPAPQP